MNKKEFEELVNKHIELCNKYMIKYAELGDIEKSLAYAGGVTALTLLKRELNGEREY